jgi:hypothetical protein
MNEIGYKDVESYIRTLVSEGFVTQQSKEAWQKNGKRGNSAQKTPSLKPGKSENEE